jgi:hypothetical protein
MEFEEIYNQFEELKAKTQSEKRKTSVTIENRRGKAGRNFDKGCKSSKISVTFKEANCRKV